MSEMLNRFYSHGKILLSGEYLVLKGARALALPLNVGQELKIFRLNNVQEIIYWDSYQEDNLWFRASFYSKPIMLKHSTNPEIGYYAESLLQKIKQINPSFLNDMQGRAILVEHHLEFDRHWGWGSSSTLINNLAAWAGINPYHLLSGESIGSGYDIACGTASGPFFYQLKNQSPSVEPIQFNPHFISRLYIVYLGKKQVTSQEVKKFLPMNSIETSIIEKISNISEAMAKNNNLEEFENLIREHENILAKVLDRPTLQEAQFSDYFGTIKSLGAWGGDYVLATCPEPYNEKNIQEYFKNRGYDLLFPLKERILI